MFARGTDDADADGMEFATYHASTLKENGKSYVPYDCARASTPEGEECICTMNSNLMRLIPREVPLRIHRIGDKLVIKEVRGCNLVRGADGRDGSVGLTFPEAMQTHIRRQEWL
eukprot:scaffold47_cov98-Skeletonema_menzelii.AAC.3